MRRPGTGPTSFCAAAWKKVAAARELQDCKRAGPYLLVQMDEVLGRLRTELKGARRSVAVRHEEATPVF